MNSLTAGPPSGDSRYPTDAVVGVDPRRTYLPRVEPRPFPSVQVPRKQFTPPIAGMGPRTLPNRMPSERGKP